MKMNRKQLVVVMALAVVGVFSACDKEEEGTAAPVITVEEIGADNSGIGYIGDDLHVEAEIVAEGYIATIAVEVHDEDAGTEVVDTTFDYTDQTLLNTDFHKHIEIPATAAVGEYHFHLVVTDKLGQQTTYEQDVQLQEGTSPEEEE